MNMIKRLYNIPIICPYFTSTLINLLQNTSFIVSCEMDSFHKREDLKDQICDILMEREKDSLSSLRKEDLIMELEEANHLLVSAKGSREVLVKIYKEQLERKTQSTGKGREQFEDMKKDYAEQILVRGRLEAQVEAARKDYNQKMKVLARLRDDLMFYRRDEDRKHDNPFVGIGVPYGGRGRRDRDRSSNRSSFMDLNIYPRNK